MRQDLCLVSTVRSEWPCLQPLPGLRLANSALFKLLGCGQLPHVRGLSLSESGWEVMLALWRQLPPVHILDAVHEV